MPRNSAFTVEAVTCSIAHVLSLDSLPIPHNQYPGAPPFYSPEPPLALVSEILARITRRHTGHHKIHDAPGEACLAGLLNKAKTKTYFAEEPSAIRFSRTVRFDPEEESGSFPQI